MKRSITVLVCAFVIGCGGNAHPPPIQNAIDSGTEQESAIDSTADSSGEDADAFDAPNGAESGTADTGVDADGGTDADQDADAFDSSPYVGCTDWKRDALFDALRLGGQPLVQATRVRGFGSALFVGTGSATVGTVAESDGSTWSLPSMSPAPRTIHAMDGTSATDLWAVGTTGAKGVAYHRDATGMWNADATAPAATEFLDVAAFSSGTVLILGGGANPSLWSNGAFGWGQVILPTLDPGTVLTRVWGFSDVDYYLAGSQKDATGKFIGGVLFHRTISISGAQWKTIVVPADLLEITDIHGSSTYDLFLSGVGASGGIVYHLTNLATWDPLGTPGSVVRYTAVWSPWGGAALAAGTTNPDAPGALQLTTYSLPKIVTSAVDTQADTVRGIWMPSNGLTAHIVHLGSAGIPAGHYVGTCTW